jgi:hypothetical protein
MVEVAPDLAKCGLAIPVYQETKSGEVGGWGQRTLSLLNIMTVAGTGDR